MDRELTEKVKNELALAEAKILAAWSLSTPAQLPPELTRRIGKMHFQIRVLQDDITREQIKPQ